MKFQGFMIPKKNTFFLINILVKNKITKLYEYEYVVELRQNK